MSPTLTLNLEKETQQLELDLNDLVQSASKVIAPQGPLQTFAARSPWAGLEQQTFEETARKLKGICNVDMYPNEAILQAAIRQGEINPDFLEKRMQQWLNDQSLDMPRDIAEQYCRKALEMDELPLGLLTQPEIKEAAKKLSRLTANMTEKRSIQTLSRCLEQLGGYQAVQELNRHMIKWCKVFLDESQAVWQMPHKEEGFYSAWRKMAPFDPALKQAVRRQVKNLPNRAEDALGEALMKLEISNSTISDYLEAHLLELPGWAGSMLWRSQQSRQEQVLLTEYLAVRISMEWALVKNHLPMLKHRMENKIRLEPLIASWVHWGGITVQALLQLSPNELKSRLILSYRFDKILRSRIWQEAWEKTYEEQLKEEIAAKSSAESAGVQTASLAQFAFCIDVRSEPFRRQLEQAGPFETFGTAGFFGLPIKTTKLASNHNHNSLPVMFQPQFQVREIAAEPHFHSYQERHDTVLSFGNAFKTLKHNLLSSLLLPEISGPWLSLHTLTRSFIPRKAGKTLQKLRKNWMNKPKTELTLEHDHLHVSDTDLPVGFTKEERAAYVRQALKMMGLTDHFAPLVVICGHGSYSTNNPYGSALDCGACGGASSGFNARVLASLCNLPDVRQKLAEEGIWIPPSTVFSAAEHITTMDELRWVYVPELSEEAQEAFAQIQASLPNISKDAAAERIPELPNLGQKMKNPKAEAERMAEDWSEVRPEWGLARNAAFIIGDRQLTKGYNLKGRVFLHNYHWQKDKSGSLLANIIAGPATVAQWINLQYYASTVAPHYYGSGNKATQTITSGIGVMQGNGSDLISGLPWQSVMKSDQEAYHAPIRLLVVIQAPREYIKRVLHHDSAFLQKVQNGWIRLASIDPEGNWESWS